MSTWGDGPVKVRLTVGQTTIQPADILSFTHHANCCDSDIGFGAVCSASVNATICGQLSLFGSTIVAELGAESSGSMVWHELGTFVVSDCKRSEDSTTITAQDAAWYATAGQYVPTVVSGTTVYNVLADVANQCSLSVEQTTLNYGLQIPVSGTLTGHTCREMLGYLAALCAKNCVISRDGEIRFVWFTATADTIDADRTYAGSHSYSGNSTILGLKCTVPNGDTSTTMTAGNTEKAIEINCPFMTQSRLDAIWSTYGGYIYPIADVGFYGGAEILPGDAVTVEDVHQNSLTVPVMSVELAVDGGSRCTIRSFGSLNGTRGTTSSGPRETRLNNVEVKAGAALLSANGKNKNFYQASAPTTADGLTPGDLWFDTANGNRISEWTGSAWSTFTLQNAAISNLDVGAITSGRLSAVYINVEDLFAQDITATGIIRGARFTTGGRFSVDQHGYLQSESGSFSYGSFSECHMQNGYVDICSCEDLRWFVEYWGNPPPEGEPEDPDTPRRYDRRVYRLSADSNGYAIGAAVLPSWYSDQLTPQVVPDPNELWEEASNRMTLARFWADSNGTGWVDVNGLNATGDVDVAGAYKRNGKPLLKVENKWKSVSINANGILESSFSVELSGYTAIGVVGFHNAGSGSARVIPYNLEVVADELYYNLGNLNSSQYTGTLSARILYLAT